MRGSFVRVDGLNLHVLDSGSSGDGRPVVLAVHGIPERGEVWQGVAAALGERARVIAPDLPGFGRSDKPAGFDYSIGSLASALGAIIDEVAPDEAVHLAVHDLGGPIGLLWGVRNQHRVRSLLVSSTTVHLRHFRPPLPALVAAIPLVGEPLLATGLRDRRQVRRELRRACGRPLPDALLDELLEPLRQADGRRAVAAVWGAYRRGLRDIGEVRRRLGELAVPATVLAGERDPFCPPTAARAIAAGLLDARVRTFEGCGHFLPCEAPAEVAAELSLVLDRVDALEPSAQRWSGGALGPGRPLPTPSAAGTGAARRGLLRRAGGR